MAQLIAEAIDTNTRALIEAGTGTGKTLAYLVPALQSKKKTLVSTATKNLQEQIYYKDVPTLLGMGFEFEAVYLKGRSNYLCLHKFKDFQVRPLFRSKEDTKHFQLIEDWALSTKSGDRAELRDLPDDFPTWFELSATSETCLGAECPDYEGCFVTQIRRKAAEAQLVIVNHHLFFADLSVRAGGFGEVLPETDVVIFDEAHHLEDTATSFFGRSVSPFRMKVLVGDLGRAIENLSKRPEKLLEKTKDAERRVTKLFKQLASRVSAKERAELSPDLLDDQKTGEAFAAAKQSLTALRLELTATGSLGEVALSLSKRCGEIGSDIAFVLEQRESGWVYFSELRGRKRDTVFLQASPIDIGPMFRELLYPKHTTTIFTSATLTVDHAFDYYRSRIALGVDEPVTERLLPSPFHYMSQSLLFVPEGLSQPNAPDFVESVAPTIEELLEITGGRAFVLFTSYRNMRECYRLLSSRLDYPLLLQGERSRTALLEEFKAKPTVLFATSSFWEGVDVPGDHLSLVVIDKLPFASPGDPIVKARVNYVEEQGGEPFWNYQLPEAAIGLKQGFGRLIRSQSDRGIVAILDRRLLERSYGKVFLNTLPRTRRTRDIAIVREWWARHGSDVSEG